MKQPSTESLTSSFTLPGPELGDLLSVHAVLNDFDDDTSPPFLSGISLEFTGGSLIIMAESDYDTITSITTLDDLPAPVRLKDLSGTPPWSATIGLSILWSWRLINQSGSPDGCQIQFSDLNNQKIVTIQLLVVASELVTMTALEVDKASLI